jgi:ubiquinone biosynthesis protein
MPRPYAATFRSNWSRIDLDERRQATYGEQCSVEGNCRQTPETVAVAGRMADYGHHRTLRVAVVSDVFVPHDFVVAGLAVGGAGGRTEAAAFVSEQRDQTFNHQDVGKALMEVARTAAQTGLYVPTELTLLGKTLLQLEQVGKILCPTFNPNASVRRHVAEIMTTRLRQAASPGHLLGSLLEMKDFVGGLPGRVNKILDAVGNSDLEVNVRTPDARHLLNGFEKIANRVTTGIILAALIVGAALMMRINSTFQIFGYPGIAMICFLIALGGSGWLVLGILWKDYKDKHKRKE